jgi:hypothetical protein
MNQCVCVLRILITKNNILPFSNYNVRIYNFLQKFAAHLKPCGGTPLAEHWTVPIPAIPTLLNFQILIL